MKFFHTNILCLSIAINSLPANSPKSAVTHDFSGGRFGDNLVSYCHAKWISYKYNIPLLYKPFCYSDQLELHRLEIPYSPELEQQFTRVVIFSKIDEAFVVEDDTLYVVPFFPESIFNREDRVFPYLFDVDWNDAAFKAELRKMIKPVGEITLPTIPPGAVSIAIHVRKGTGWDIPNYRITPDLLTASHPLRFAPDSFFIEQLKKMACMFANTDLYIYLFTDHNNPAELVDKYRRAIQCDRMMFDYRKSENNEFINVLDDFFALTYFDCLIRADSNFSIIASKLANYKLLISPWHGIVNGKETIIDEINFEINGHSFIVTEDVAHNID